MVSQFALVPIVDVLTFTKAKHWSDSHINPCIPGRTENETEERKKTGAILRDRKLDNFMSTKTV